MGSQSKSSEYRKTVRKMERRKIAKEESKAESANAPRGGLVAQAKAKGRALTEKERRGGLRSRVRKNPPGVIPAPPVGLNTPTEAQLAVGFGDAKYQPGYHDMQVLQAMAQGASFGELCLELGICPQTLYRWQRTYEGFAETVETGRMLSMAWWMREGRVNLGNVRFNSNLWFTNMSNRFGWARRVEGDIRKRLSVDGELKITARKEEIDWTKLDKEELQLLDKLVAKSVGGEVQAAIDVPHTDALPEPVDAVASKEEEIANLVGVRTKGGA